jgi:kinesin family protein 3/17
MKNILKEHVLFCKQISKACPSKLESLLFFDSTLVIQVILDMDSSIGRCNLTNPGDVNAPAKSFTFDGAYFMDSTTEQIYNEIVFPLVEVRFLPFFYF